MDNKPSDPKENQVRPQGDSLESAPSGNLDEPELSKADVPTSSEPPPAQRGPWRRLLSLNNKYFVIFIVLLLVVSVATYLALNSAKKSNGSSTTKAQSLTSQQLAAISGSTTVVGDTQQNLDVQSNSVFEGQVLLRKNLDVAGTIKVGGGLSLPRSEEHTSELQSRQYL